MSKIIKLLEWKLLFCVTSLGCILWWGHAILNPSSEPNEYNLLIFILASICKILIFILLPFFIIFLCRKLYLNKRILKRCIFSWLLGLLILTTVISLNRDRIANLLNNSSVRFYYIEDNSNLKPFHFVGREEWLTRWKSGEIICLELLLGLIIIGCFSLIGYFLGKNILATLGLFAGIIFVLAIWARIFQILILEYDEFLGGVFSDSISFDIMWPFFAWSPVSQISFAVCFVFVLTSVIGILPSLRTDK